MFMESIFAQVHDLLPSLVVVRNKVLWAIVAVHAIMQLLIVASFQPSLEPAHCKNYMVKMTTIAVSGSIEQVGNMIRGILKHN